MDSSSSAEGIIALCAIAHFYHIPADPKWLMNELQIEAENANADDILRAANRLKMKSRIIHTINEKRLISLPVPAIARFKNGRYYVLTDKNESGLFRVFDAARREVANLPVSELLLRIDNEIILVQRRLMGEGSDPRGFSVAWFMPTLKRYKQPLIHVVVASFFIQIFALITPLFFQIIIDKVLVHKSYETLIVLSAGLFLIGVFDVILRYLRTYVLAHTANRIDVELGRRLFHHLFSLPMRYFESRSAGNTVARIRELENIRNFLTGQALFSAIDLFFIIIFIAVLFIYSSFLAMITVISIPVYVLITMLLRPAIKKRIDDKFYASASSQQFLVETVVGAQTIKASAVEPSFRRQWEERLARYVHTSFEATQLTSVGQNSILFTNKLFSVLILFFGATAVINGDLTVGELIAFNMISGQVMQPILRISQLWQDFQQVQVSVERLGDILDQQPEFIPQQQGGSPPLRGHIRMENVSFSYKHTMPPVLRNVTLEIQPGEVIGIVGASGSGKSTLTKLIQRLYMSTDGRISIDNIDINHADPAWLRRNTGVVLQENVLFNRSIHDNIAFANPTMSRSAVIQVATLAGADEFITLLPEGYDTIVEERGGNFSGGQRQRIAIARALATNPPLLILDEATSALDYESENIIRQNMQHMVKGRTVIIIAHRLSTVRQCTRIVSMHKGNIAEQGTHDELLRAGGIYAHLWSLQNDPQSPIAVTGLSENNA
ncbi:type I secretion system permease/ATPase [Citrobacter portucalensis]|uniref:peptidase domain-containing ABC transporter n=1 Tax=Citrobacter portucalensis TaxID=1639133 RepID=UPI00226B4682|nr:type I secretion system permease/ATPase [Citrobacter portucalensis]MCX8980957.1 type I secretion system permease/ATPase [Citrobacter portucalensis]